MMGNCLYISLRKVDFGSIYFLDYQQRECWDDEQFYSMFENLAPDIEGYLDRRRNGLVPEQDVEMSSVFVVAASVDDFLRSAKP